MKTKATKHKTGKKQKKPYFDPDPKYFDMEGIKILRRNIAVFRIEKYIWDCHADITFAENVAKLLLFTNNDDLAEYQKLLDSFHLCMQDIHTCWGFLKDLFPYMKDVNNGTENFETRFIPRLEERLKWLEGHIKELDKVTREHFRWEMDKDKLSIWNYVCGTLCGVNMNFTLALDIFNSSIKGKNNCTEGEI